MATELPVVVPEYAREICHIVDEEKCGITAECENAPSVAAAILWRFRNADARRAMGKRAPRGVFDTPQPGSRSAASD